MNTIRELKQQEKYKSMLKRKNKEKKIYKDKNASLQLEKQRLYIALRNKDKEIERLNNIIEDFEIELQREINVREEDTSLEHNTFIIIQNTLKTALKRFRELKGSDEE